MVSTVGKGSDAAARPNHPGRVQPDAQRRQWLSKPDVVTLPLPWKIRPSLQHEFPAKVTHGQ